MMTLEEIQAQFLREAKEDYIGLWEIVKVIREEAQVSDPAKLRAEVISVVEYLLEAGCRPGQSPYKAGGFQLWPEMSQDELIHRVISDFDMTGNDPGFFETWLSLEQASGNFGGSDGVTHVPLP